MPDDRAAFKELAGAVARGEVGIVLSLESARLARNGPDWANLLFLCRWSETLIADRRGIYDLTLRTDRMVLGLQGQMSELEIDTSIERMHEARRSKAARGELVGIVAAGYDIDDQDRIVRTCNEAVADAIATVFATFLELGAAGPGALRALQPANGGGLRRQCRWRSGPAATVSLPRCP